MVTLEELYQFAKKNNLTNVIISYPIIDEEDGTDCFIKGAETAVFVKRTDGSVILDINGINSKKLNENISLVDYTKEHKGW